MQLIDSNLWLLQDKHTYTAPCLLFPSPLASTSQVLGPATTALVLGVCANEALELCCTKAETADGII